MSERQLKALLTVLQLRIRTARKEAAFAAKHNLGTSEFWRGYIEATQLVINEIRYGCVNERAKAEKLVEIVKPIETVKNNGNRCGACGLQMFSGRCLNCQLNKFNGPISSF
jgi:hypothetical protein